jgi:hypothetical protein
MVAARESWATDPIAVRHFERFFRLAVHPDIDLHGLAPTLDIDKSDLRRLGEFVNDKIADLVAVGQEKTRLNTRKWVEPYDLPITKGLQENIHNFRKLEEGPALLPVLTKLTARPPLPIELDYALETEESLPLIAGGICMTVASSFKIVDPDVKNPTKEDWDRAYRIYRLLL